MENVYCIQCKKTIGVTERLCPSCGADQRPPSQRPVPLYSPAQGYSSEVETPLGHVFLMWGAFILDLVVRFMTADVTYKTGLFSPPWFLGFLISMAFWITTLVLAVKLVRGESRAGRINGGIVLTLSGILVLLIILGFAVILLRK